MKGGVTALFTSSKSPRSLYNLTGSLTPVLHLERKAEFHVSTRDEAWLLCWNCIGTPRAMSDLERRPEVPASTQGGPMPLQWLEMNPEKPLTTLMEAWLFAGKTSGSLRFPSELERNPKFPAATLENQEILPSTPDEALFCCSISREIPPSLLSLKRVLDTLYATEEFPQHTLLHSRGTSRFPHQLKKSPVFPSSSQDEGPFPCFVCKGIPKFPSHLKRRPVSPWNSRGTPEVVAQFEKTLMSPSIQDKAWFPCNNSNATPSINSCHKGRTKSPVAPLQIGPDLDLSLAGDLESVDISAWVQKQSGGRTPLPQGTSVFSLKAFNWSDEVHPHYGEQSAALKSTDLSVNLI